ncbi:MAG: universal stress protein [Desulfobacula sp.]|uniref:universal stress protein n=1 Tax=Desulfobacula sp. TaxID=2593537 RepID=UPI0025C71087|nr:universal stress protein [Desulfobacula sp.]MCD4721987.1 universal stress protein [Desulfobacula sp.]
MAENKNKNKILVALDGSKKAFKTIEYLCKFKPFLNKEVVLYNVISSVPDCYYDLKKEAFSHKAVSRVKAWEMGHRKKMEKFMEESRMMLIAAGFKPEAITIMIKKLKKGVARDILAETQKGYDALLIRRRGAAVSFLPIIMGSVATKLVEKEANIPLFLAGTHKVNHSIFIAVDGSDGSNRAIEFLAKIIENSDCRIVLCSVLRDYQAYDEKETKQKNADCIKASFEGIEAVIEETTKRLESVGIKREKIESKIIQGAKSRAGAIVEAAKEEDCDTIVFGRRGKSKVANFDIGRVPWKVIHGARKLTVWVIP